MTTNASVKLVYWHRELPPLDQAPGEEGIVEARSDAVPYRFSERDQLWARCHDSLMTAAAERLAQEVSRLGGSSAHVIHEAIEPRINHATGEYWLSGRFSYVLYHPARRRRSA